MYSFWAMNSLRMSFWTVPERDSHAAPCFSATTRYIAQRIAADEVMVMDVVTSPSGMPSNSSSMSARDEIATPHLPTSPSAAGLSLSYPIRVGRSNATDSPVCPCSSRNRKRRFVSCGVPYPANWRIVQSRWRYMSG